MKKIHLVLFFMTGLINLSWGQAIVEDSIVDAREIMQKTDEYCEQLQYFRRNYDDFAVEQSLLILEELISMGRQIRIPIDQGLQAGVFTDKSERNYVKTVGKQLGKIDKSLDRLEEYVRLQNYKRKSSQPGGHSPIETQYFSNISRSVKIINKEERISSIK